MNVETHAVPEKVPTPSATIHSAPTLGIQRILVAVDFSECSKAALDYALGMAEKLSCSLALLHAVEPCVYPEDLASGITVDEIDARWTKRKKEELEEFRRKAITAETPSTLMVTRGTPWKQIVDTAKTWNADLIVLGTRGLTGIKHVLLGSTAERVVRHATCPVLVVHAQQH